MGFQDLEDLLTVFEVRLVARRAERRGGSGRDRLQIGDRLLAEVDEVVVDDPAHAMKRAVDVGHAGKPPRLERHADQRLVDDRRRTAALGDKDLVRHEYLPSFTRRPGEAAHRGLALGWSRVTRKTGRGVQPGAAGKPRATR